MKPHHDGTMAQFDNRMRIMLTGLDRSAFPAELREENPICAALWDNEGGDRLLGFHPRARRCAAGYLGRAARIRGRGMNGPEADAAMLTEAKRIRARVAADLLRLPPHRRLSRRFLKMVRRLAIFCEDGARKNLEEA